MAPRISRSQSLGILAQQAFAGGLNRRAFLLRAAALGVSLQAGDAMFRAYTARAQDDSSNPITVTVGGTPIAAMDEDLSAATPGGTLRFGRSTDSDNLDPVTNDGNVNIWYFMSIYDQLVRVAPDGISLEPALAESWEISDDGITYTFHLREGVLFSDGTPFTADDVIYSYTRAANDPDEHWTFTLTALQRDENGQVQGITAPDANTVVVELAQPWAPFLSDVAMFNMSIISKAFAEGNEETLVETAMGTGPFALQEWKRGETLTLVKNTNYWEEGLPLLDSVVVSVVPDDNARILQLQGGELDAMMDVPSSRVPELQMDPNLKVYQFPSTLTSYITFNTRNAPLNDVHARKALQYATDRQTLNDVVLFGVGIPATSFMPKGALYWNDALTPYAYDVEQAKAEMAQSATPEGFPLELKIRGGSPDEETLATALKDMWSQVGVDVTITPTEGTTLNDDYNNQNFQAMTNYWTNDIIDPDELVAYAILPESSQAFQTGWVSDEAQKLARDGAAELDDAKRDTMYRRIQEIYNDESPMLALYYRPYLDITTTKVHNFGHPPTGEFEWRTTWIEQ
ncbi:MAG: ABC transporter substrate-binding protein [Thermomicrobiales bacterium]